VLKVKKSLMIAVIIIAIVVVGGAAYLSTTTRQPVKISIATCSSAGAWYPIAGVWANYINQESGYITATVETSGCSSANAYTVNRKEVDVSFIMGNMIYYAWTGHEPFNQSMQNARGIAVIYPDVVQFVVLADTNIYTIPDLKGKIFAVGSPGSGNVMTTQEIFSVYNMTFDDIKPQYIAFTQMIEAMKNKQIDGCTYSAGIPTAGYTDLASVRAVRWLPIDPSLVTKKYSYYVPCVIPANTYPGQTTDVVTVGVTDLIVCNKDLPDDVVYTITKIFVQHLKDLQAAHPSMKQVSLDTLVKGMPIPWHPGAEKYYREIGLIK
jgi:TRAP transporter TAXI family solute receptor